MSDRGRAPCATVARPRSSDSPTPTPALATCPSPGTWSTLYQGGAIVPSHTPQGATWGRRVTAAEAITALDWIIAAACLEVTAKQYARHDRSPAHALDDALGVYFAHLRAAAPLTHLAALAVLDGQLRDLTGGSAVPADRGPYIL